MIKILHSADWHPRSDGTLAGKTAIDPSTGLSRTLTDFTASLQWIYNLIKEEQIDLVLLAGDIFDSAKPTVDETIEVLRFLRNAAQICPVVVIAGNHDLNQNGAASPAISPGIFIDGPRIITSPETLKLTVLGHKLAIDCLPYPTRGRLIATADDPTPIGRTSEELNATINEHLKRILWGLTMNHEPGDIRILLAHGSVDQAKVNDQPRSLAHDIQIPIGEFDRAYDYIALGHIHQPQRLGRQAFYSGSLLRGSFGEENEEKGVWTIELHQAGLPDAGIQNATFHNNPHARTFKTVDAETLDREPLPMDLATVYRIKGELTEERWQELKAPWILWTEAVPYLQTDVTIVREDRARDSQMSDSMSMDDALDRTLEREGILDPLSTKIREIHRELVQEVNR